MARLLFDRCCLLHVSYLVSHIPATVLHGTSIILMLRFMSNCMHQTYGVDNQHNQHHCHSTMTSVGLAHAYPITQRAHAQSGHLGLLSASLSQNSTSSRHLETSANNEQNMFVTFITPNSFW